MANIIGSSLYAYPWVAPSPTITAGEYWFKEELDLTAAGGLEQAIGFTTPNYNDAPGAYVKITAGSDRITYNAELSSNDLVAYVNGAWLVKDARLISVTADTIVSKEFYNWFTANTYTSPFDMTYTGNYNVREDGVVELLTSGTLVFLNPAVIDVFCVGGGGAGGRSTAYGTRGAGGGGGGYTETKRKLAVSGSYTITIGEGGAFGNTPQAGAATTFGSIVTAEGGEPGVNATAGSGSQATKGGAGGSGGGGGTVSNSDGGTGGYDGGDGEQGGNSGGSGGAGQGTTTREFGESGGKLYAGGGGGGRFLSGSTEILSMGGTGGGGTGAWHGSSSNKTAPASGIANTGGGGGGTAASAIGSTVGASGGSGICCFRAAK